MQDELLFRISLTLIPDLGPVRIRALVEKFGSATAVFKASKKELAYCIGPACAGRIREWKNFQQAETEILFIEKKKINVLFLSDANYPQRLLHCYDPPSVLYYSGTADLNHNRVVSIIGTRNNSQYGKQVTEELVQELEQYNVTTVSGLAFGIDAIAHSNSLLHRIPTVGVLAHGFDTIYPSQHKTLAKEVMEMGGLLTEFKSGTLPDKHNFPKRNRIVAGMSDVTIVIETALKGGSMITATLAHEYNRDLFAVPGKITDAKSSGCIELIKQNKASIFTNVNDLAEAMGWLEKKRIAKKQKELFIELNEDEKIVLAVLKDKAFVPVDELFLRSGLSNSKMANVILELEMKNLVRSMPGKRYRVVD